MFSEQISRRTVLDAGLRAGMLGTGSFLLPARGLLGDQPSEVRATDIGRNWAGNVRYSAARLHEPTTVEALQAVVRRATKVKALGSRHSFTRCADTLGDLVSMAKMPQAVTVGRDRRSVTVPAGMRYGELALFLDKHGLAVRNFASLPHTSVGGTISTATHGSGKTNGNLASSVSSLMFVDGRGNIVERKRGDPDFNGSVVALGAIGVLINVTLDVVPSFRMRQLVWEGLPFEALKEEGFSSVMGAGYSVSFFIDYRKPVVNQVWVKLREEQKAPAERNWLGASPAPKDRHPIVTIDPVNCTPQMGVIGPSFERLPHFKLKFTPSAGNERHAEYFVPAKYGYEAIKRIYALRAKVAPALLIGEIRWIAGDELWLSPAYGGDVVAVHFTWIDDDSRVLPVLPFIEEALKDLKPRPHWGKLTTLTGRDLESRYPKMSAFRSLATKHDPDRKFGNEFLGRYIYG